MKRSKQESQHLKAGATALKYLVKYHPNLEIQDIPLIPLELVKDFCIIYKSVLVIDPFKCGNLVSKNKRGRLQGYQAISLDYDGVTYRIIYRIYDKPAPKRVEVIAFGEHDLAYEKAQARSL